MKSYTNKLCAVGLLAFCSQVLAETPSGDAGQVAGFLRPEIGYVVSTTKILEIDEDTNVDMGGAFSFGLTGGVIMGKEHEHEVSLTVGMADFSPSIGLTGEDALDISDGELSAVEVSLKTKTIPLLLNYRYTFGSQSSPARFYIAPSIGITNIKLDVKGSGTAAEGGATVTDLQLADGSTNSFTWGMGIGAAIRLAEKVELDLGYRYTSAKLPDSVTIMGVADVDVDLPTLQQHAFNAGVTFRF